MRLDYFRPFTSQHPSIDKIVNNRSRMTFECHWWVRRSPQSLMRRFCPPCRHRRAAKSRATWRCWCSDRDSCWSHNGWRPPSDRTSDRDSPHHPTAMIKNTIKRLLDKMIYSSPYWIIAVQVETRRDVILLYGDYIAPCTWSASTAAQESSAAFWLASASAPPGTSSSYHT